MIIKVGDKKRVAEIILILAILFVFLLIIYFVVYKDIFLVFTRECNNQGCFNENLVKCRRARWVNDAEEATWIYTIRGKTRGECQVRVELAVVKEGKMDLRQAEGKEMDCYLPFGAVVAPEKKLSECTGVLKEELQDLTIQNLFSLIYKNCGKISEELLQDI